MVCTAAQGAYFAQLQGPPDPEQIAAIWAGHPGRTVGPPIEIDTTPAAAVPDLPRKAGELSWSPDRITEILTTVVRSALLG
jgi:hypothetical protein